MQRLIECVPNFSEGRDLAVIAQITDAIETVDGRDAARRRPRQGHQPHGGHLRRRAGGGGRGGGRAARKAAELIDMRKHHGEHPRFGAMDVCPLVPVAGITMEETVEYARALARRLGEEVGLTVYCYENAAHPARAPQPRRRSAPASTRGSRRSWPTPHWKPDFGPATFNPRSGATAVGARDFLVAYNVNLNTTSTPPRQRDRLRRPREGPRQARAGSAHRRDRARRAAASRSGSPAR